MNTKIITALVIATALVGLTGAASASSVTAGTYYDYLNNGAIGVGETNFDHTSIDFDFDIGGDEVTGGAKTVKSSLIFVGGNPVSGIVIESLTHHAEIENTITSVTNKMGKKDRMFTTTDFAYVDLTWQEAEDGVSDIDKIGKSASIDSDAYATDDVPGFYKKDVLVEDMSTMSGVAVVCDDMELPDPTKGTLKAGDFSFGSSSFVIVETEGDMLQAIFAGSGLDYEQSNWGKLENNGMIYQEATVDQYVTVNVSP